MATHKTHKRTTHGKLNTCHDKQVRRDKQFESVLAERALARLIREVNGRVEGA